MLNVMVTGLLCISMLLVASSCNLCLFTVKFYWNIKKEKKKKKKKKKKGVVSQAMFHV